MSLCDDRGHPLLGHAGEQPGPQTGHQLTGALVAHGPAQLVGLGDRQPGDLDGDLHQLLLEERNAEGPSEDPLEGGLHHPFE